MSVTKKLRKKKQFQFDEPQKKSMKEVKFKAKSKKSIETETIK